MEDTTPVQVRCALGKPETTYNDFIQFPLARTTDTKHGVYLNHVVDSDGEDGIYVGSSISDNGVAGRVHRHRKIIKSSKPVRGKEASFHYAWMKGTPERTASFKLLAQFEDGTPSWVVLLMETVFIIMLRSYSHNPTRRSNYDNSFVNELYQQVARAFGCTAYGPLQGLNRTMPIRQGMRALAPKVCDNCKTTNGQWKWKPGTIYGSIRWCIPCYRYWTWNGKVRPESSWAVTQAKPEKICGNCGCDDAKFYRMEPSGANGEQQNLCWTCAKYWQEHHFNRPDYMIAHQKQKRAGTCVCMVCGSNKTKTNWFRDRDDPWKYRCGTCHNREYHRKRKMKKALAETMLMDASAKNREDKLNNATKCAHCDKDIKKKVWIEGLNAVMCLPCGGSIKKMGQLPITFNQVKDLVIRCEYCGTLYATRWTIRLDSNGHHVSCRRCAQSSTPNLGSVQDPQSRYNEKCGAKDVTWQEQ
jgi:hypothetical protein